METNIQPISHIEPNWCANIKNNIIVNCNNIPYTKKLYKINEITETKFLSDW